MFGGRTHKVLYHCRGLATCRVESFPTLQPRKRNGQGRVFNGGSFQNHRRMRRNCTHSSFRVGFMLRNFDGETHIFSQRPDGFAVQLQFKVVQATILQQTREKYKYVLNGTSSSVRVRLDGSKVIATLCFIIKHDELQKN